MTTTNMTVSDKKATLPAHLSTSWGTEDLDTSDIIIPRLLLCQAMSTVVQGDKAKNGDMVNSLTGEVLVSKGKKIDLVLVDSFKNWIITNKPKGGNKFEFKEMVPWRSGIPTWKIEENEKDGSVTRRYQQINFYVLESTKIDQAGQFPLLLTFRSSSYNTGKKVATFGEIAKLYNKPLGFRLVTLGADSTTNELGTFNVFTAELGREATTKELEKAYLWYKTIRQGQAVTVKDADNDEDVPF